MRREPQNGNVKPPLQFRGIAFALAANLLLVTSADLIVANLGLSVEWRLALAVVMPLLAGGLTAYYIGSRGAMHAFLGGMISVPLLALFVLPGLWRLAFVAGALCGFGGAFTELLLRRFSRRA